MPSRPSVVVFLSVGSLLLVGCGFTIRSDHRSTGITGLIPLSTLKGQVTYSAKNDIWVANTNGTNARRLTRGAGPEFDSTWSPDGTRIAYRDSRRGINNNDEIYVVNVDGTQRQNLTNYNGDDWGPAWSPDGNLIAYNSDGQLYVMRPDGGGKRLVTNVEGEYPAWSPDGKRLAFMSQQPDARGSDPNYDVVVVNLDGSNRRRLTNWPGEDGWPAWSPDGRWVAFTTTHDHGPGTGSVGHYMDIWVVRPDGSSKRRVVRKIWGAFPVWSPDGRAIMFVGQDRSHPDDGRLWAIRPDGSGARALPIPGGFPDWIDPAHSRG